jgi:hypothetical protein
MPNRQESFIDRFADIALEIGRETGIAPEVILGQTAIETGWGKSAPQGNMFGIKGPGQVLSTLENYGRGMVRENHSFRTYQNPEESFQDYANLTLNGRPLTDIVNRSMSPKQQIAAIKAAGYATDPNYVGKVNSVMSTIRNSDAFQSARRGFQERVIQEEVGLPSYPPTIDMTGIDAPPPAPSFDGVFGQDALARSPTIDMGWDKGTDYGVSPLSAGGWGQAAGLTDLGRPSGFGLAPSGAANREHESIYGFGEPFGGSPAMLGPTMDQGTFNGIFDTGFPQSDVIQGGYGDNFLAGGELTDFGGDRLASGLSIGISPEAFEGPTGDPTLAEIGAKTSTWSDVVQPQSSDVGWFSGSRAHGEFGGKHFNGIPEGTLNYENPIDGWVEAETKAPPLSPDPVKQEPATKTVMETVTERVPIFDNVPKSQPYTSAPPLPGFTDEDSPKERNSSFHRGLPTANMGLPDKPQMERKQVGWDTVSRQVPKTVTVTPPVTPRAPIQAPAIPQTMPRQQPVQTVQRPWTGFTPGIGSLFDMIGQQGWAQPSLQQGFMQAGNSLLGRLSDADLAGLGYGQGNFSGGWDSGWGDGGPGGYGGGSVYDGGSGGYGGGDARFDGGWGGLSDGDTYR